MMIKRIMNRCFCERDVFKLKLTWELRELHYHKSSYSYQTKNRNQTKTNLQRLITKLINVILV